MSELKISPNQFLEQQELNRLKKFVDTDGFRNFMLLNANTYGLIRKNNELFSNGLIQEDTGLTIKINPIRAIDNNGKLISSPATSQLSIPPDNNFYWIKIAYQTTTEEIGTFSIDANGNLVCTSADAELLTIIRGQPNHPSRITFTNAVNNIIEYDVLEVIDDNNAVLQGSFVAESGLRLAVVGTFTQGYVPLTSEKYIFQYDSCLMTLVSSNTIDPPAHTTGLEFILGRVKNNGVSLKIEDRRNEIFQTEASYFQKFIETNGNPLIGVEQINYDDLLSPKVQNLVQIAWAFTATSYSVNLKLNTITINSGSGGLFKASNFGTEFTDGDFDGWRVYVANGKYFKVQSSSKVASNIELIMDNLSSDSFFSDFDSSATIVQDLIVTPDAEEIEIIATPDPTASSPINNKKFVFPINESYGRIPLNVYATTGTLYNIKYRYKHLKEYSPSFILPDDAVGYYNETQFNSSGVIVAIPTQTPYVSSETNGYIPLMLHPDAYSIFENRIDLGDLLGVQKLLFSPSTPVLDLTVGSSRQYQYFSDGDDSTSNDTFTLLANMYVNIKTLNVLGATCRNGNFFMLHFKQKIIFNGFVLRIVSDYVNPTTFTLLKTFNDNDERFLARSEEGIFVRATFDGTSWFVNSTNEVPPIKVREMKTSPATYTCTALNTLIPGLTYTTPNDGKTRKLSLTYKGLGLTDLTSSSQISAYLYNATTATLLDSTTVFNGGAVVQMAGSGFCTIIDDFAPDTELQVVASITNFGGGGSWSDNKFTIIELED